MKKTLIAAILVVVIVAAAGVTIYTTPSQVPPLATNGFTAMEQQLNDLQDFAALDNLNSDLGMGEIAGNW